MASASSPQKAKDQRENLGNNHDLVAKEIYIK
jgi:hypothetical protein